MRTPAPTLQHIEVGPRLALWHWADGSGQAKPVLLCLHGYMDTGLSFSELAHNLCSDFDVYALDLRGHGSSEWVSEAASYHLLDHVKDLHHVMAFFEEHISPPSHIIGHSMAVNILMMRFGAVPDPTPTLIFLDLIGPPPETPEEQPERLRNLLTKDTLPKRFLTYESLDAASAHLRRYHAHLDDAGAKRMLEPILKPDADNPDRLALPFDPRLRGPTPVRYPESFWKTLCGRIQNPVQVITGDNGYVAEEFLERRAGYFADIKTHRLERAGHHIHVTHFDFIADLVLCHR